MGIEPTSSAWKAEVLPLNYTRLSLSSAIFQAYKNPDSRVLLTVRTLEITFRSGIRHADFTLSSCACGMRCATEIPCYTLATAPPVSTEVVVEGVGFEPT
jgi:hypothetical protein